MEVYYISIMDDFEAHPTYANYFKDEKWSTETGSSKIIICLVLLYRFTAFLGRNLC